MALLILATTCMRWWSDVNLRLISLFDFIIPFKSDDILLHIYLVNLRNIHAYSQVITHVSPDSSTQHGAKQPVILSKNLSSAANALNAAGSCIPPVIASSNELARTPCQQMFQINSQGRGFNVI